MIHPKAFQQQRYNVPEKKKKKFHGCVVTEIIAISQILELIEFLLITFLDFVFDITSL